MNFESRNEANILCISTITNALAFGVMRMVSEFPFEVWMETPPPAPLVKSTLEVSPSQKLYTFPKVPFGIVGPTADAQVASVAIHSRVDRDRICVE